MDKLIIKTISGETITANEMGIKALRRIYKDNREILRGATVTDIIIGKGAACFLIAGGIKHLNAGVISRAGLDMLQKAKISVTPQQIVPMIINRKNDGQCPIENLLRETFEAEEGIKKISAFFNDEYSV
ncbi:MAG: DUF1893 domain-containing protein [Paludibacteraceae bacterium]|nr:DUF1893 domain-containing protein [Paludibacteraceae bacterium]